MNGQKNLDTSLSALAIVTYCRDLSTQRKCSVTIISRKKDGCMSIKTRWQSLKYREGERGLWLDYSNSNESEYVVFDKFEDAVKHIERMLSTPQDPCNIGDCVGGKSTDNQGLSIELFQYHGRKHYLSCYKVWE
jgi:hypothetical protein